MKRYKPYLYCCIIGFVSCFSNKKWTEVESEHESLFSIGAKCTVLRSQGTDSHIGNLTCGSFNFDYDYGRYSNSGPMSLEEDFMQSFRAVFYASFFEKIHLDPKVYKLFVDSVRLVAIEKYTTDGQNLFTCSTCNSLSQLEFRGRSYFFPYSNDPSLWTQKDYIIKLDTLDGKLRKMYYSKIESLASGLYMADAFGSKQNNKLSITTHSKTSQDQLFKLLRSVTVQRN